ncbi:MAG: BTAD domain-containing putative transcriptional regulator, partial [Actinomycetota bacterium]
MEYRILGSLEVRSGDRTIPLGGVKQRALLAALLVHPNQVVSVDSLIEHLWGDAAPARAHNNLQVYVSRLRRAFEGSAGDSPLLTRPPGYLLRVDDEQLDGRRFERLQARGKALLVAGEAGGALNVLDEALSLWRGPALADFAFESFARSEITRLDELRLSALEDRVDAQLALGHEAEVVGELESLTAEHPLRERLRGQLMHALYRCGRQAEALATYREARRALADELGLEPGPDLRELEERILRQDPALRTPAASDSREAPSALAPHDIPRYLTRFIGRARELHEVRSRLRNARLLTLTGVAGSGKTRLAFEVASELLGSYPSGVRVVALDSLGDPGLVQHAVATAVGVRPQGGSALIEVLVDALETQRTLLVLDNCEHLLQACAELVRTLLTRCPDLQVLATSRERLSVAGELVWQVPPMPVPQSVGLPLESLEHHEAIELFIDRATAAWPHFELTARNVPVVTQICTRLDGLPLALELAAAQVGSLGLDDIAAHLQDRFLMLNLGDRTAHPRQQTLQRAIDWSYELLEPKEQVLFASLSVFAGEFDLDAAEMVCPSSDVEAEELVHLLTRLVDKSLVARVPTDHGRARYRLLESLRQFGRERLGAAGLEDDLRGRHAEHYLELAARAEAGIRGPDQGLWLDRLEADLDNLRSALEWGRDRGGMGLALATSMWWFWESRGYPSEGLEWLSEGLDSDSGDDPAVRAKAQAVAASVALAMGDLETGTRLARASHETYARLDDPAGLSVATHI